ncbi:MAG: hypothetical protein AB8H47_05635 [Bacteroidia bacterium]
MKKILYLLPLVFILACEPQVLPDLTLANLNGNWQVEASGEIALLDSAFTRLDKLDFQISLSENGQYLITGLDSVPRSGSYQQADQGQLLFALPGLAIIDGLQDLNVKFQIHYNLPERQEWQADGQGILDNQAASYYVYWNLKRIE